MLGTKVIEEVDSPINGKIRVIKALGWGTYIQVDGLTQSGGVVNSIWKSVLRRVKNNYALCPIRYALILGLGGGTVAKLIRKYWPDAKITGVDIDPVMVEMGKKYLGLNKLGVKIKICDAFAAIKDYSLYALRYDLIVVDLYCGYEYPKKFESDNYIHLVGSLLTRGGVVIFNRLYLSDSETRKKAIKFGEKLEGVFSKVEWFYPSANLMFICIK